MSRKGENIYRRKDGRWEGRYIKNRAGGKTFYGYVYGKTYKETRERLSRCRMEWMERQKSCSPGQKADKFGNLCNLWLADAESLLKESTIVKYKNLLRSYILPALGQRDIEDILTEDICIFCNSLLEEGGAKGAGLSAKTVADVISLLKTIQKYGLLRNYQVNFLPACISVRQSQRTLRILSIREEEQLYRYLDSERTLRNLGIMLCLFTGIRLGELCALKWDDISLTDKNMRICKTMQRIQDSSFEGEGKKTKVIISAPKSACAIRVIPLPENLMVHLEKHYIPGAFLLTGETEHFIEPRGMERHFQKVLEHCKIERVNFHVLRHTFATRCVELGFDMKCLSEILGHANINITLNRYVHPSMEHKKQNMSRISKLFNVK